MNEIIFPLKQGMTGQAVADLQDALLACLAHADVLGKDPAAQALAAGLKAERAATPPTYGNATSQLVGIFHREVEVDEATADALNSLLKQWGLLNGEPGPTVLLTYNVSGTVVSPVSAAVGGLTVQIVDKAAAPDLTLATTKTNNDGSYAVTFTVSLAVLSQRFKTQADLQAQVMKGTTVLAASAVAYNAAATVILNVTIPANATGLPTEYEALTQALSTAYTGKLGALEENGVRTDVTFLANKTGWDARAVALAALADQFATPPTPTVPAPSVAVALPPPTTTSPTPPGAGAPSAPTSPAPIRPEFYYALFRAGLPANASTLYRTDLTTVGTVWNNAIAQGIIPASLKNEVTPALQTFQSLNATTMLDAVVIPNTSSLRSLLAISLGANQQLQQQFATLYAQFQNDPTSFWAAAQSTFGQVTSQRLQLDGQLGFLTLNNAQLITNLHQAEQSAPLTSMLDLVRRGYYQASKWEALMTGVTTTQVPGTTATEQHANFATLLATQLRLSYPTEVLSEMVNNNAIPLTNNEGLRSSIYQFFVQNQGKYQLGVVPIDQYISQNGLTGKVDPNVVTQIKRLQRVYQITPSDTAMNGLLTSGVDSAYAITHYGQDAFVREFQTTLGGADVAALTFAKAQAVYNTVLNVTTDYLSRRVAPALGNGSARYLGPFPYNSNTPSSQNPSASATLETLFGSLDYCQCDECRSILGPAAYMVDLLNTTNCQSPPAGTANPQSVLFTRRPDLKYLPLTCDNTNTAQPYIDLVNEILEYYAASGSLNNYQGFTTDASVTSSAELIATPQNVNDAAYTILKSTYFPPPLPYDRSLEMMRLLFQKFDVNLQDAMAALRPSDAIERPSGPGAYGWRDILMEEIGLSRAEYQILTDSTLTLQQIYGYPGSMTQAQTITALSSVQDYTNRLNLQFNDLLSIVQTHFVNPFSPLIPQLETLNVTFAAIAELKNGTLTPAAFLALLPTGPGAPNPADFGGDIVAWLTDATRYPEIMVLITLANPTNSTDLCSMTGLQFRYANPDNTANTLQPIDFVRMLRFIRLWQKLGLTVQQTDDIISALAPTISSATTLAALDTAFLALLPRIGFLYRVMSQLSLSASTDLESILPLWGPIGIYGAGSLYATMFLNPTMLKQDPAFAPDSDGNVLQDTTQTLMATPTKQKGVVGGTFTVGDMITTTINGILVNYPVGASDTSAAILAGHVAATVNADATIDPVSGQALNKVISAANAGAVITFAAIGSGGAFSLVCSVSAGATETYVSLDHAPALCAAFNLTAAEFLLITQALGFDSTTVLNLANISAVYRYGWLARQLQISVLELLLLVQYTGLNPFAPLDPSPIAPAEPPIVAFINLVQAMSNSSLQPVQPLYLLWNQDITGTSAPTQADINALAFTLRGDFAAVDAQFAIVDDPSGAIAKSLMTLVYGTTATNFFFGLLNNTLTLSVSFGGPVPAAELTASSGRLTYDDLAKQLTFAGVLDATTLATLNTTAAGNAPLLAAISFLQTANQAAVNPFFTQYPELLSAYNAYASSSATLQDKRTALLANLLPALQSARKQEQALAAVSAAAGIDPSFATAVFNDASVMHSAASASQPAIIDLTAVEAQGLMAQFFRTNNTSLPPDQTVDNAPVINYAGGSAITLPPGSGGSKIAAIFSGYLDCPQDGNFNFSVTVDAGATVTLVIGGQPVTMALSGNVWTNSSAVSLTAGDLTSFVLTAQGLTSTLSLAWQGQGIGWQIIPGNYLYSQTILGRLGSTYTRYLKGASLATDVSLDANELTHLATQNDYQVVGVNWLNALPVSGNPNAATSSGLYNVLTGVLTFSGLKLALSPKDERFLNLLQNPAQTLPNGKSALLTLTNWDPNSLNALLTQFFGSNQYTPVAHVANFARVYDAFAVVKACGIAASSLIAATTNAPAPQTVVNFEAAVRARYAEADWLTVIKPINDSMRQSQRDALVPYVLGLCAAQNAVVDINTPVNTADTLFEYLLVDVEMQPCMLTSRIRLALSTIQLFIERCIRGLELNTTDPTKNVDPSCFNPSTWTWMKRYRVWEANREVFLWPENWLYPELRDDQTAFFSAIMGKLLQSDITDDTASYAYLEYLKDLESVAKLEPCAIYYVPSTSATTNPYVYVVGRTTGAKRVHYYRYFDGAAWGPWQQIPLTIDDKPLLLTVWKNRLLLFWLQVVQTPVPPPPSPPAPPSSDKTITDKNTKIGDLTNSFASMAPDPTSSASNISLNLFWSEYYNGKWQAAKSSDTNNPAPFCTASTSGPGQFDRTQMQFTSYPYTDPATNQDQLWLTVVMPGFTAFCLYNTHSLPVVNTSNFPEIVEMEDPYIRETYVEPGYPSGPTVLVAGYMYDDGTTVNYFENQLISTRFSPVAANAVSSPEPIRPDPNAIDWTSPFFYEDSSNVFYVETSRYPAYVFNYPIYGLSSYVPPAASQGIPLTTKNGILLQGVLPKPDPIDPNTGVSVINPGPIARYVTEDAFITKGLGSTGSVRYGNTQIGISGAIATGGGQ